MNTVIFEFNYLGKKGPTKNQATVEILPPENGNDMAAAKTITFKDPVKCISHEQIMELLGMIELAKEAEENEFKQNGAVTVGEVNPSGLPALAKSEKGILGFKNNLQKAFSKVPLSPEEKKQVDSAFAMVENLLGFGKKKNQNSGK